MAKENGKTATQTLSKKAPKKGSVLFEAKSGEADPLFSSLYLMREGAKKQLGLTNLDDTSEIEVTVRVK